MTAPLIGITGHQLTGNAIAAPPAFQDAPFDGYLREYATVLDAAGGVPVYLPHGTPVASVLDHLHGLLLAGGEDVDPRLYGSVPGPHSTLISPARDLHELDLLHGALDRGIPVLAVCRGIQLVNVALGGTLIDDLPTGAGESHGSGRYPRAHRSHEVRLAPGSTLANLLGPSAQVNSYHHQAVDQPGEGLDVTGLAPDGVIEAVEHTTHPLLGVQWHPECFGQDPVFEWLVAVSGAHQDTTRNTIHTKERA